MQLDSIIEKERKELHKIILISSIINYEIRIAEFQLLWTLTVISLTILKAKKAV